VWPSACTGAQDQSSARQEYYVNINETFPGGSNHPRCMQLYKVPTIHDTLIHLHFHISGDYEQSVLFYIRHDTSALRQKRKFRATVYRKCIESTRLDTKRYLLHGEDTSISAHVNSLRILRPHKKRASRYQRRKHSSPAGGH